MYLFRHSLQIVTQEPRKTYKNCTWHNVSLVRPEKVLIMKKCKKYNSRFMKIAYVEIN